MSSACRNFPPSPPPWRFEFVGRNTRFSTILRLFAASPRERIAIGELLDGFGDRSFGAAMLLLALPNMVPLPPGASTIFGLPLMLIAAQLAVGRRTVWLPAAIRNRSISTMVFSRIVDATRPYLRRAERLLAPRLQIMLSPISMRLIGVACFVLAVLIALPIPLANFLCGLAVAASRLACFAMTASPCSPAGSWLRSASPRQSLSRARLGSR